MNTLFTTFECWEKELEYITKQIKIIFNLHTVFVEHNITGCYFKLTFIGHPLFTFRVHIILYSELKLKSYEKIIQDICKYLIEEMDV